MSATGADGAPGRQPPQRRILPGVEAAGQAARDPGGWAVRDGRKLTRWLALAAAIGMFVVLAQGALVTTTGSGEGCGQSWPLCRGEFVPTYAIETMIEFSHRFVTGVEGFLIMGAAVGALSREIAECGDSPGVLNWLQDECRLDRAAARSLRNFVARQIRVAGVVPDDRTVLIETFRDPAGEMGLDYHYDHSPRDRQRTAFAAQLALAAEAGKPAVIHAREADEDVAAVLRDHPAVVAVLHSFSSGLGLLRAGLVLRHYVSFSGMVTFKNWRLDQAILETPMDRLLLETDGPYLAPVPHRGKRNEPAFVRYVAERIAALRQVPLAEVIRRTAENAARVFGLHSLSGSNAP